MKFLQTLAGNHGPLLLRALGHRNFAVAVAAEDYAKRNYANNESEYNTVIASLTAQRRHYILRDVYDDMLLDGVQPERGTFHSLIVASMKGARLQDAFFFRDQMKSMGLLPDVALYNLLISTCGKCKNSDEAVRVFEEMKKLELKLTNATFICLLNSFAAEGHLDRAKAVVRDMTNAGLGLNKFCYAGLITAHKNKTPPANTVANILELVAQSGGWSTIEAAKSSYENVMKGITDEELYNIPTADYIHRRGGFLKRYLTVYHVAFHACADLKNVEATDKLLEMLKNIKQEDPDVFILLQIMRCYLHSGDIVRGYKVFEDYMNSGRPLMVEVYTTFIEGAMTGYTPKGMQLAYDTLVNMTSRNFFLTPKMGSDLLLVASGDKTGDFKIADMLWDYMQARSVNPTLPAVEAYYNGLRDRQVPGDDPRLLLVSRIYENLRLRFGSSVGRY